jgi:hypothetical protein
MTLVDDCMANGPGQSSSVVAELLTVPAALLTSTGKLPLWLGAAPFKVSTLVVAPGIFVPLHCH